MLCPMNALLRMVGPAAFSARLFFCGGCMAAFALASPLARADDPAVDMDDPAQAEPPPPSEAVPPTSPPPFEPPSDVLPGANAEPSGPLPELPSPAPPEAPTVDP